MLQLKRSDKCGTVRAGQIRGADRWCARAYGIARYTLAGHAGCARIAHRARARARGTIRTRDCRARGKCAAARRRARTVRTYARGDAMPPRARAVTVLRTGRTRTAQAPARRRSRARAGTVSGRARQEHAARHAAARAIRHGTARVTGVTGQRAPTAPRHDGRGIRRATKYARTHTRHVPHTR